MAGARRIAADERTESGLPAAYVPGIGDPVGENLREVTAILRRALADVRCSVWLFGSRARGQARDMSDFDIAVECASDIALPLAIAREMLEESTVPQKIDLVDLSETTSDFAQLARLEGILLWRTD